MREIATQAIHPQRLVDARVVAAVEATQPLPEGPKIPLLVSRLALGVRLSLLLRQAVQPPGNAEQLRTPSAAVVVVAAAHLGGFAGQRVVVANRVREWPARPVSRDPGVQRCVTLCPTRDEALPARALQLTLGVLHTVVDARELPRVADAQVASLGGRRLDRRDPLAAPRDVAWVFALEQIFHRDVACVAGRAAGVADGHDEIAIVEPRRRHGEEVFGLVGHVVRRVVGRFAIRRHVGAEEREVARVPRPTPVVDVAAIAADGVRGRVDEPDVADLQVLHELVLKAAEEGTHAASMTRVGLAFLRERLGADLR